MTFTVDLNGKKKLALEAVSSEVIEPMMGWAFNRRAKAGYPALSNK